MKFRVKAMRHADVPVDHESQAAEDAEPMDRKEAGEAPLSAEDDEGIPEEQLELLRGLLRSFTGLADDRATLLERMVARVNDEKTRLADLEDMSASDPKLELVQASPPWARRWPISRGSTRACSRLPRRHPLFPLRSVWKTG
jgi:hypothetical protein